MGAGDYQLDGVPGAARIPWTATGSLRRGGIDARNRSCPRDPRRNVRKSPGDLYCVEPISQNRNKRGHSGGVDHSGANFHKNTAPAARARCRTDCRPGSRIPPLQYWLRRVTPVVIHRLFPNGGDNSRCDRRQSPARDGAAVNFDRCRGHSTRRYPALSEPHGYSLVCIDRVVSALRTHQRA